MSPEEVQALIDAALSGVKEEISTQITQANKGLAASLTKEIKKASSTQTQSTESEPQELSDKLTLKSLQHQLADLQTQLVNKDKEAFLAKKSQALSQVISECKALNPKALQKLINLEFGDYLKEENGAWFVVKGDDSVSPLKDALDSYLKSDEGLVFVAPSGVNGSGSTETKPTTINPNQKPSAADALFQEFSNY